MSHKLKKYLLTSVLLIGTVAAGLALSQPANAVIITVDENGHGEPFGLLNDPGPGGKKGVLTYALAFGGEGMVTGDVQMTDADFGTFLDVVRFNLDPQFGGAHSSPHSCSIRITSTALTV